MLLYCYSISAVWLASACHPQLIPLLPVFLLEFHIYSWFLDLLFHSLTSVLPLFLLLHTFHGYLCRVSFITLCCRTSILSILVFYF